MTRSLPRGRFTGIGLLAILLIAAAILAGIAIRPEGASQQIEWYPTYNIHSSSPEGTRAFSLWLNSLGYTSSSMEYRPFSIDSQDSLLLMLFPTLEPTSPQASAITDWVKQGGTLIVADNEENDLLQGLGVSVLPGVRQLSNVQLVDPSFGHPSVSPSSIYTYGSLELRSAAWIPVLNDSDTNEIVGATRTLGNGSIYAFSTGDLFSNIGLAQAGSRDFVINLLGRAPTGSTVVIDEYHHGYTEQGTFTRQLFTQPWGQAIIFIAVLLFVFLALTGRRFGAAVRPVARAAKRARAEYAQTIASLLQQRDQREWLRDHYVYQLKRALAARFRVRSNVTTAEFVQELAQRNADAAALAEPLKELEAPRAPSDSRMIVLMRETDQLVARLIEQQSPSSRATSQRIGPNEPSRKTG